LGEVCWRNWLPRRPRQFLTIGNRRSMATQGTTQRVMAAWACSARGGCLSLEQPPMRGATGQPCSRGDCQHTTGHRGRQRSCSVFARIGPFKHRWPQAARKPNRAL